MPVKSEIVDYDAPVRLVSISFPDFSDAQILKAVQSFAVKNRFAVKITGVPDRLSDELIELFRTDIRMTGTLLTDKHQLDIAVYRTYKWNVDQAAFDQGVNALQKEMQALGKLEFNQTILKLGDKELNPNGYGGGKSAIFNIPDGQHDRVRHELIKFAEQNKFAIRIMKDVYKPDDTIADLYRQGIQITADNPFNANEMDFFATKLSGLKVLPEEIDQLFESFKQQVEQIEGVRFKFKK